MGVRSCRRRILAKFVFFHTTGFPNDRRVQLSALELEYRHARAATAAMSLPLTATRSNYTVKYADAYTRVTKLRGSSVQLCLLQPRMSSFLYLCSPKAL